ncbi:putative cyclin dependent kinase-binding protein [Trypanosoma theileri]|uniref:Putative cyclin dependent kinase-binding protein n=1 Tax=Trypanosoma theileri TaxID=67003 RepID=A0A1X0NRD0_9TRYP|nr:putative cyclin dependent kinase-binding protein [Trypanosoma theileri]ORC87043.1 putative cyclin dependent kinase-binding protein [Trypanosoma theileri]
MHSLHNPLSSNTSDTNSLGTSPAAAIIVSNSVTVPTITATTTTTTTTLTTTTTTTTTTTGNTSTTMAAGLNENDLARATAVLMSFSPKSVRVCVDEPASSRTSVKERRSAVSSSHLQDRQVPSDSSSTTSTNSHPMDDTRSSTPLLPLQATTQEPQVPCSNELHLGQLSFLTNVGEMARVAALKKSSERIHGEKGQQSHSQHQRQGSRLEWDTESTPMGRGKQLSIDKLVHSEGQRVRLRFIPASSLYLQQKYLKRTEENTLAAEFYIGTAVSISTILSSFAPPKASYWEDDRLVVPYLGERYGPAAHPHRSNKSDENGGDETGDGSGTRNGSWRDDNNDNNDNNDDVYYPADESEDSESMNEAEGTWNRRHREDNTMRSYGKLLTQHRCQNEPVFHDAFFLDTGNITGGERRKKLIVLPSYRASVISFVDNKVLKKDINSDFYVQHPELEVREIKLTHVRRIRADLLNFALEESSPIEVVTMAYANWYLERLIMRGMVGKRNRRLALAVCILLAIKFIETGDIHRKIHYAKTRFRQDEAFAGVTWSKVQAWEFTAYVGLEFTLLPENGNNVVETHLQRLLGQINVTAQEYYSKKFALP